MLEPTTLRILIADDDQRIRRVVSDVVATLGGMVVVAAVGTAEEAIAAAERDHPDVAILDVRMPGGGAHAARTILERAPATRIVALSAHDDREAVVSMLRAGALGYVVKGSPIEEIGEAILRAARGHASLSGEVAMSVAGELREQFETRERSATQEREKVQEVRRALAPGAIEPVYQVIVDLESGKPVGYEALSRFAVEPQRGPDAWFLAAQDVGLLEELEFTAIRAAIRGAAHLPRHAYLSLNLSPTSILSERLASALLAMPGERLVLEVTEHAAVPDYEEIREALAPIRRRGTRLAVDDAGAGFASLRHILQLEPDIIKIDISITRDIDTSRPRRAMGAALVSFSRELGMSLVAEGIETQAELDRLRGLGVAHGQGYFLGRPSSDPFNDAIRRPG